MTIAKPHIQQTDPPGSPRDTLPTMYDLPSEHPEDPGLPDEYHLWQAELLSYTIKPPTYPPDRVFTAIDLNLYYDLNHSGWYKRPDWFAVVGVPRFYEERELRLSYVIWQEKVVPTIIVEFLSPSTKDEDLGKTKAKSADDFSTQHSSDVNKEKPPSKWEVYERILGVPYYIVFDGSTNEMQAFVLQDQRYQKIELTEPKIWIPILQLGLGLWQGEHRGKERQWLRWYDAHGNWIPTEAEKERREKELAQQQTELERREKELAQQQTELERREKELAQQQTELAQQQIELERREKELAQQRAEQLAQRLQQLGINPDDVT